MSEIVRIVYSGGCAEIVEKKSRFIATVRPVGAEDEAAAFIGEMKKKYWDASHNCFAFVIGERNPVLRCSDDGEPSRTAGRPMLDVLLGERLINASVVVTRYFGGTLLGTGGLVRAYSGAVREGLAACGITEKKCGVRVSCAVNYADAGKLKYLADREGYAELDCAYAQEVTLTLLVPEEKFGSFCKKAGDALDGRIRISEPDKVSYGVIDERPVLF